MFVNLDTRSISVKQKTFRLKKMFSYRTKNIDSEDPEDVYGWLDKF